MYIYTCTCTCRGTYVHVMFEYTIHEVHVHATMYTCISVYNKHNKVNSKLITCTLF